jgi:putative metalloprotease
VQKLGKQLGNNINGQPVNYKVYITSDVNAWAMGNGCIRVYSALMDMMTDDELLGVIGHEMADVALGHSKKAMQTAYAVSAARAAAGAAGGSAVAALNASLLGDVTEKFINAQFSQSQESAADDYSFDQLKGRSLITQGLVTGFQKLAKLDGGKSDMMSSHPSSTKRAEHIQQRIASNK